jgi:hypothetical protein
MFLGPTLATLPARARSLCRANGFQIRRPVRRGDIDQLLASRKTRGLIVIVDGVFHDTLAVGHAEIREALRRGWRDPGARDGAPRDARVRQRLPAVRRGR